MHFRQAYGFFYHYLNMGMYLIFVACLTFTVACTSPRYGARDGVMMLLANETFVPEPTKYLSWMVRQVITCAIPFTQPLHAQGNPIDCLKLTIEMVLATMLVLNIVKEFVQMYQQVL